MADGLVDAEDLYDAVVDCAAENAENFSSMCFPRADLPQSRRRRGCAYSHDARRRRDRDAEILVETGARPRYQDCRLGRPTEVDFLSGWVVARARARGSDAPENARLADAVRGLEAW